MTIVTKDIWDAIFYADLYEKGIPPVAGGALDQAFHFTQAFHFIIGEKFYWKAKMGILTNG